MSLSDLLGILQSAKAFAEQSGVDTGHVTLLAAACFTAVLAFKATRLAARLGYSALRGVKNFAFPRDEICDELLAVMRGYRGQVVVEDPCMVKAIGRNGDVRICFGCTRGQPDEILSVFANGAYQPIKALSPKAKGKIIQEARKMSQEKRSRDQLLARENFLSALS